ncbi:hypothetical protein QFC19_001683 [Naganishia cerealis]|uniref:Uncharacterized protein n=1 Tax=Naganishia cerealis TaxID=610337 RepID=A0ACC2WGK4_9TREE|nr:hypothetical protein QFC19_001683 [Naganishia cerealis]
MVSFKSLAAAVVATGFAFSGALAELSIVSPSSEIFWVGLNNPDVNLLTSKIALTAITDSFNTALTIQPVQRAGDNYVIELTDILNSSNIYATSQPFSIKQQGSLYPTATTATSPLQSTGTAAVAASSGGAASSGASGSRSASASASASSAAAKPSSGAMKNAVVGGGALMAVAGAMFNLF